MWCHNYARVARQVMIEQDSLAPSPLDPSQKNKTKNPYTFVTLHVLAISFRWYQIQHSCTPPHHDHHTHPIAESIW